VPVFRDRQSALGVCPALGPAEHRFNQSEPGKVVGHRNLVPQRLRELESLKLEGVGACQVRDPKLELCELIQGVTQETRRLRLPRPIDHPLEHLAAESIVLQV
jgi:hypothetical protein